MPDKVYNLSIVIDAQNKASPKLKSVQSDMGGLGKTAKDVFGAAGLSLGIAGIATAAIAAGGAMTKLAMDAEQTKVAFTTLIGSAAGAQAHLNELRAFAASTPFQFTDLTEASKKMQAFGFESERVIPMMTSIGDAVSAMGGGAAQIDRVTLALGQMSAKGKVQAGEMMQLTEAGIPAWRYLAEAMGKSTAEVMKLSEKGLIPAGDAINYILDGMSKDFGGMMAQQADTAAGRLSNLQDKLESVGTSAGNMALPILNFAVEGVSQSLDLFGNLQKVAGISNIEIQKSIGLIDEQQAQLKIAALVAGDYTAVYTQQAAVVHDDLADAHAEAAAQVIYLEEQEANLTSQTAALNSVWQGYSATISDGAQDANEAAEAIARTRHEMFEAETASIALAAGLRGTVGSATEDYTETTADLATQIAAAQAEMDKYTTSNGQTVMVTTEATATQAEYELAVQKSALAQAKLAENTDPENTLALTVAAEKAAAKANDLSGALGSTEQVTLNYNTKIGETQARLDELTGKQTAAQAALRATTNEFLYQTLAVEGNDAANLALARQLGLIDEQSYAAAEAARKLKEEYMLTDDLNSYTTKTGLLADAIANLQDKKITITVDAITNEIRNIMSAASNAAMTSIRDANQNVSGQAQGGPIIAGGAYMFNESSATRPEVIVTGNRGGYTLTKQDAQAALAGAHGRGGNTYNVTINDQLAAKLFLEDIRRREMETVNGLV